MHEINWDPTGAWNINCEGLVVDLYDELIFLIGMIYE